MMQSSNECPYPECYVAFLDILGFKDKVKKSNDENKSESICELIKALRVPSGISRGKGKEVRDNNRKIQSLDIRGHAFSDSLLLYAKSHEDPVTNSVLANMLFAIRYLHDQLLEQHLLMRGFIGLGKMYFPEKDDRIAVGEGIVDAYEGERGQAIYPRVVVSEALYNRCYEKNIKADPFGKCETKALYSLFRKDFDGRRHLDLLSPCVMRSCKETFKQPGGLDAQHEWTIEYFPKITIDTEDTENIWVKVECMIKCHRTNGDETDQRIAMKYDWLSRYLEEAKK